MKRLVFFSSCLLLFPAISFASEPIDLAAVSATSTQDFTSTFSGKGTNAVGEIDIRSDWGSLVFEGQPLDVLVYEQIPWTAFKETLFQFIGRRDGEIISGWIYCNDSNQLDSIWYETTSSPTVSWEDASGTCQAAGATTPVSVSWPAMTVNTPAPITGFSVSGTGVSLTAGSSGTLDGRTFLPYATVDCSKDCGTPGWYELHGLILNSDSSDVCFGILYLFTDGRPTVELGSYSICFPSLNTLGYQTFTASWQKS